MIYSDIAVPIQQPGALSGLNQADPEPYMFDQPARFSVYHHPTKPHSLMKDDRNQWYATIRWELNTLTGVKYARQVHRPSYLDQSITLKLIDYLAAEGLKPQLDSFDKAFVHTTVFAENLDNIPLSRQLRIANADGEDDPSVMQTIHFIENVFNGQRTRFSAGFETFSISTVTENRFYLENVHLSASAFLYLQYFVYFHQYGFVPSKQMMAKLLENLWASTQSRNTQWNASLFTVEQIKKR